MNAKSQIWKRPRIAKEKNNKIQRKVSGSEDKKERELTFFGFNRFLFSVMIEPVLEKSRSQGTEVA